MEAEKVDNKVEENKPKKGKLGLISIITGIIVITFIMFCFSSIDVALDATHNKSFSFKFTYLIGFNLFSLIVSLITLLLAFFEKRKKPNIANRIGFILGLIALALIVILSIVILVS